MGRKELRQIEDQAAADHMAVRALLFLEAAIAALLDTHTPKGAAEILRAHAQILEEHG